MVVLAVILQLTGSVGPLQAEKDYSAQSVMHINHAYQVLRAPLSRANYLVKIGDGKL